MGSSPDRDSILNHIGELKQLFQFGGELMPFLDELHLFMKDVMPLMDNITNSLIETKDNMPMAQDRIDKVTEATLMATQQILDKLDYINSTCDKLLEDEAEEEKQKRIQDVQNATMEITFSLQFQDITSQKLGHAKQILTAIYERFDSLFKRIDELDIDANVKSMFFGYFKKPDAKKIKGTIDQVSEDHIRTEGISQDDIDKLFD